jgi:serine protease
MKRFLAPWVLLAGAAAAVLVAWDWGHQPSGKAGGREAVPAGAIDDDAAGSASSYDLLVDFRDDTGPEVLAATPFVEESLSAQTAVDKLYRIRFDALAPAREAARLLAQNPAVESVDWDAPATLPPDEMVALSSRYPSVACEASNAAAPATQGFPDDPCYRHQWNLRQIGLPAAWKLGQGQGVVVAVIDTGVTPVPDLAGVELVEGYDFVGNVASAADDHGHGTHVAGTIAQATNNRLGVAGIAFGAKIMPLKVLSASGTGTMGAIAQAIRYAADHGAQVINMSLGGPWPVMPIHSAIKYAVGKGVIVVAAAGNDGGRVGYPARYPEVLAVSATQFDEKITFYSSRGPEIGVAAPGGNIRVDQNGDGQPDGILQNTVNPDNVAKMEYLMFMGTSMASPHVAGVAALLVGAGVTRPAAVLDLMTATARRPQGVAAGSGRVDNQYGAGIIDAGAALTRSKVVGGAGGLGLAAALAFVGLAGMRRRGALGTGFWAALGLGASGLFFVPLLLKVPAPLAFLTVSLPEMLPTAAAGFGQGNPLLWGALLPLGAIAILHGVGRLHGILAGLAFGIAGALAVAGLTGSLNVTFMPDLLDRAWLLANTAACVLLGRSVLRR